MPFIVTEPQKSKERSWDLRFILISLLFKILLGKIENLIKNY